MATMTMPTGARQDLGPAAKNPSSVGAWLHSLVVRFESWRERRRQYLATVKELNSLSDRELDDIGVVRCDIKTVARGSVAESKRAA